VEIKKSDIANIEKVRLSVFLVSLVVILSFCFVLLEWKSTPRTVDYEQLLQTLEQDLDIEAMKEKEQMVAAISSEQPQEEPTATVVQKQDIEVQQPLEAKPMEATTSEIVVNEEKPVEEQATIHEVSMDLVQEDSKYADEIKYQTFSELPEFPGGHTAFIKWLTDNLKYPDGSQKRRKEGRLVASFVVDATGNIQDLKIKKGVDPEIDRAVLELLNKMPKWTPGHNKNGSPCPTLLDVPIDYYLHM